jgi:hypothetical protein
MFTNRYGEHFVVIRYRPNWADDIADYIWRGGLGSCDWKIILVVGDEGELRRLRAELLALVSSESDSD